MKSQMTTDAMLQAAALVMYSVSQHDYGYMMAWHPNTDVSNDLPCCGYFVGFGNISV